MKDFTVRIWNNGRKKYDYFTAGNIKMYIEEWQRHLLNGDDIEMPTGLKDTDGNEIFPDSDVLISTKYPDDDPCPYTVTFYDGCYHKKPFSIPNDSMPVLTQYYVDLLDDKVIGTIKEGNYKDRIIKEKS